MLLMIRFITLKPALCLFLGCNKPDKDVKTHASTIDFELPRTTSTSRLYFTAIENLLRQFTIYDKCAGALIKLPSQIGIFTCI